MHTFNKNTDGYFLISVSSSISEISLTVAEEGRPVKDSERAHQIEKCDCPVGYSGLSCEVGDCVIVTQEGKGEAIVTYRLEIILCGGCTFEGLLFFKKKKK